MKRDTSLTYLCFIGRERPKLLMNHLGIIKFSVDIGLLLNHIGIIKISVNVGLACI